jgi:hypothetical protein
MQELADLDPFGPDVRAAYSYDGKFARHRRLGLKGVRFHDDTMISRLVLRRDGVYP